MLGAGVFACMLIVQLFARGKATIGNETACGENEEFRRNSGNLELGQKSRSSCHPKYGIIEEMVLFTDHESYMNNTRSSRCFCKDDHYMDENNKCQPFESCKSEKLIDFNPQCKENEEYSRRKCNLCPARCHYDSNGQELLGRCGYCLPPGCFCKRNYFLDEDYKCVLPKDCPPYPEKLARTRNWRHINIEENSTESNNSSLF